MKIEDLRINQIVKMHHHEYREWDGIECRIVGISITRDGKENITVDDGSGYQYDGWLLNDIVCVDGKII